MACAREIHHELHLLATLLVGLWALGEAAIGQQPPAERPTDCSAYAAIPLPAEADKVPAPKAPPDCASYRSYRGIGRPVNYAEARACAWQERLAQQADLGQNQKEPNAWIVGGSLILADIYFNGAGVNRNIPLAMRFACEAEEGMATLALPDIEKLSGSLPSRHPFEFCQYAASTITMNFCSSYAAEIEDSSRSRFYDSLKSSMSKEQRAAFDKLLAAQNAYIESHASEVDQGGTIRGVRTIGSQNILKNLFHGEIVNYEHKMWPALSESQIKSADAQLHREYENTLQHLRTHTKDEIDEGAVTAGNLADVQKTWDAYSAAWDIFARLRYPATAPAIHAQIILDRYRLLKTIR